MTHFYTIGFTIACFIFLATFILCMWLMNENQQLKQKQYPRAAKLSRQQKKEFTNLKITK